MPVTEIARLDRDRSQWDDAFYAFLAEKERRSRGENGLPQVLDSAQS
jgi:hypothetical protein